jgi:hypothetical protein
MEVFEQSLTPDRAVSSEGEPSCGSGRGFNPYIACAQIQLGVVGSARLVADFLSVIAQKVENHYPGRYAEVDPRGGQCCARIAGEITATRVRFVEGAARPSAPNALPAVKLTEQIVAFALVAASR